MQQQVERLQARSDQLVRGMNGFLAEGGFTEAERKAVEFARQVLRVAASMRAEIAQPMVENAGNTDVAGRRQRHADAARALIAARDVVEQAEATLHTGIDELPMRSHSKTASPYAPGTEPEAYRPKAPRVRDRRTTG